ncbi:hypothetical protein J4E82_006103 [Alternaria postmessia]|uniref:uncharacterized protein n=1 Tax=Alternaria postmessia TaxID=1187938 RepID=UPI002224C421|nr:uncharacterized protein J4E82_006103 [Alternaria postmessia]KAI5375235.1 hypothetical protein J4E82_006103 [Alternaria postmessia]
MQTQARSSPMDPSEVSFLTTLPPEIRNQVYGYLFKREDSVLLHNAHAFHLPCRNLENYHSGLQQYYDAYEAEIGTDEEFWPDLHQGLGLMLSCRQVYQEASGIMYGGNTFVFSRILTRHDYRIGTDHKHQEYLQINYAGQWLTNIGPQIFRLTKVVIDVDAMCAWYGCHGDYELIDLLPILRIVWEHPDLSKVIKFENTGRTLEGQQILRAAATDGAILLNNLLTTLAVQDVLDLRKYCFSRRLIHSVNVELSLDRVGQGCIRMNLGGGVFWPFLALDEGRTVQWKAQKKRRSFEILPEDVRERIAGLLLHNPDGITIDLTKHTMHGFDSSLSQSGLLDVYDLSRLAMRLNNITLKLTSDQAITDFGKFEKVNDFMIMRGGNEGFYRMAEHLRKYNTQTIILEIAPAEVIALSAVRVNINHLMYYLTYPHFHPESIIRLTLTPPPSTGAPQQITTISMKKLQRQLFLLLSDIIQETIEEHTESLKTSTNFAPALSNQMNPYCDFWIDGYGKLLHAVFEEDKTTVNFRYGKLSMKELGVLGYSRAAGLESMVEAYVLESEMEDTDFYYQKVILRWGWLRWQLYGDWKAPAPPGMRKLAP